MARRRAREVAFRTLFQAERGAAPLDEVWRVVRTELGERSDEDDDVYGDPLDREAVAFAGDLVAAFGDHRDAIDDELERTLEGWTFNQMAQTDLNILRLALTEMRHFDTPPQVVIEMAVRLAKRFGGDQSGRFVNGVLGRAFDDGAERSPSPSAEALSTEADS